MESKSYQTLNAWLQKADWNYVSGRLLWLNALVGSASNLLWLSSEQIVKILLLQRGIDSIARRCADLDEMHTQCEAMGRSYGHDIGKLTSRLAEQYPSIQIDKYTSTLKKLHEHFFRRYVVRGSSSISMKLIKDVDAFYFELRDHIHPDVGVSTIDEIFIQRKHQWGHPLPAFGYAYFQNPSFRPRKHRSIRLLGPDGLIYEEDGC